MRSAAIIVAVSAALLLPACSREEEPVADKFDRQKAEIENKARTLETQVENEVSAAEARLQNEVETLVQNQSPPPAEANVSDQGNRSR